jgi:hypothetical protein
MVHVLTAGTPVGGGRRTPADGGRADTPAGGWPPRRAADRRTPRRALRYRGTHIGAHAMGEGMRTRKGPHRGCREDASHRHSRGTPGAFCTCFYDHARRLRLEKLLCLELSRSPSGIFKPLPNGCFGSETAKNLTAIYLTDIPQRTQVSVRV